MWARGLADRDRDEAPEHHQTDRKIRSSQKNPFVRQPPVRAQSRFEHSMPPASEKSFRKNRGRVFVAGLRSHDRSLSQHFDAPRAVPKWNSCREWTAAFARGVHVRNRFTGSLWRRSYSASNAGVPGDGTTSTVGAKSNGARLGADLMGVGSSHTRSRNHTPAQRLPIDSRPSRSSRSAIAFLSATVSFRH